MLFSNFVMKLEHYVQGYELLAFKCSVVKSSVILLTNLMKKYGECYD